ESLPSNKTGEKDACEAAKTHAAPRAAAGEVVGDWPGDGAGGPEVRGAVGAQGGPQPAAAGAGTAEPAGTPTVSDPVEPRLLRRLRIPLSEENAVVFRTDADPDKDTVTG